MGIFDHEKHKMHEKGVIRVTFGLGIEWKLGYLNQDLLGFSQPISSA